MRYGEEMKLKKHVIIIILLSALVVSTTVYLGYSYMSMLSADKTWIRDLGYEQGEIYRLTFNWPGDRSCPEIPVKIESNVYRLGFDTGCGTGLLLTNVIEDKINYTIIGKTEALNRDGSHRGWEKRVLINEISVFGDTYKDIETSISDWSMFSSRKFNGLIGLAYFESKIITLDYAGRKIGISNNPIDYSKLDSNKYVVLPLYKTTSKGQETLPFFEAELKGKPITVYLDTGKNYSYIFNPNSKNSMSDKPREFLDVPLKIGSINISLYDVAEVNDLAHADGLPYPTMIELNSDQLWKNNLLVTFDLIEQKIIFRIP
ncbi:MAG: hypothetical protein ACOZCL_10490 [Bacillota bacterium]